MSHATIVKQSSNDKGDPYKRLKRTETYLVAEEVLGEYGQVAILLLELGRLFCEGHVHVVAAVTQMLVALALH
jgi:hypothetical protein